jgi:membrane protein YfhO
VNTPAAPVADAGQGEAGPGRWWLLGLVVVSLLPNLRAAWPGLTYYFRDFTVTFYPLRAFFARELAAGRWPGWNPYVYEGLPALPTLYPPDLLHVLWPGPAFASWLLTLHFPLAALAACALARDLGIGRAGSFVAGAAFSLSGLCQSSLNLYVFLQALALAPLVVLGLRRAALRGGRWVPAAAAVLAVAVSTLAVEFVAQAVLLGLVLGCVGGARPRAALRLGAAVALGAGLAAVPVLVTAGVLRESVRGAGFVREVALGNAIHPAALLQALVPDLFGSLAAPVEVWWGGRFFSKGFPYLLSLYLGPLTLALAATGRRDAGPDRRQVMVLAGAGALGLWYALGAPAGLASWMAGLPGWSWFRFPSKALLLPVLAVSMLAGGGADRLARGQGWPAFLRACLLLALVAVVLALMVGGADGVVASWAAVPEGVWPSARRVVLLECAQAGVLAAAGIAAAALVRRGRVRPGKAVAVVAVLAVGDLARAAAGLNPQAPPALFALLPELAGERLDALDGGRVFSYGLDESPAFRRFLAGSEPGRGLWSFFLSRQMLVPYASLLDRVETAHGKDLTSFVPRPPELEAGELDPGRVASILGRLRPSAVSRVLSLDPLGHPDLHLRARVRAGPPGLWVHVFELDRPAPRVEVGGGGAARPLRRDPSVQEYEVDAPGAGELLVRDSYARGWRAWVDGEEVPVRLADGKHRAVAVPSGRHRVRFAYAPPGLRAGLALMALSALAAAVLTFKPLV